MKTRGRPEKKPTDYKADPPRPEAMEAARRKYGDNLFRAAYEGAINAEEYLLMTTRKLQ